MRFLKTFNFVSSKADSCIFVGSMNNIKNKIFFALYVDDGLLACESRSIETIVQDLNAQLEITISE